MAQAAADAIEAARNVLSDLVAYDHASSSFDAGPDVEEQRYIIDTAISTLAYANQAKMPLPVCIFCYRPPTKLNPIIHSHLVSFQYLQCVLVHGVSATAFGRALTHADTAPLLTFESMKMLLQCKECDGWQGKIENAFILNSPALKADLFSLRENGVLSGQQQLHHVDPIARAATTWSRTALHVPNQREMCDHSLPYHGPRAGVSS